MDPNANLEEQRRLAAEILGMTVEQQGETETADLIYRANRLAELVEALDGWLKRGGFLPKRWKPGIEARRVIPGERIATSTGMREVLSVHVDQHLGRVLITVADPAGGPPDFATVISYPLTQLVEVGT